MSEDNVLRPNIWRKPEAVPKSPPGTSDTALDILKESGAFDLFADADLEASQRDLMYMLTNRDVVRAARDTLSKASDTITSLTDFVADQESINLRRQELSGLSLEEICAAVAATDESQWKVHPSYFGALLLEHQARVDAATSWLPSETDQ